MTHTCRSCSQETDNDSDVCDHCAAYCILCDGDGEVKTGEGHVRRCECQDPLLAEIDRLNQQVLG